MFFSLWVYYTFIVSFKTNFQNHNRTSITNLIINKLHHSITTNINLITRKAVTVTFELSPYISGTPHRQATPKTLHQQFCFLIWAPLFPNHPIDWSFQLSMVTQRSISKAMIFAHIHPIKRRKNCFIAVKNIFCVHVLLQFGALGLLKKFRFQCFYMFQAYMSSHFKWKHCI